MRRSLISLAVVVAVAAPAMAQNYGPLTQDKSVLTGGSCLPEPLFSKQVVDSEGWTNYRLEFANNCNIKYKITVQPIPADAANPPVPRTVYLEGFEIEAATCYINPRSPSGGCKGFGEITVERQQ